MSKEELYRADARRVLGGIDLGNAKKTPLISQLTAELWRFRESDTKALFLDEALHYVQSGLSSHLLTCTLGSACLVNQGMEKALFFLQEEIAALPNFAKAANNTFPPEETKPATATLAHLHPIAQQAASSLYATGHYRQAVLDACIALDKAVQSSAGLPASQTGVSLMTTAFSAKTPLIRLSHDLNERTGFMNLFQGSVQAIRNHYAHNLTEIYADRALEWLSFISALFNKLDEAIPIQPNSF